KYFLVKNLQVLPNGYFYFYVDLPSGYKATYVITNGKANNIATATYADENEGAYVPPSSIVTQTIKVAIIIDHAANDDSSVWAEKISDTYTKQAELVAWDGVVTDEFPDY
ncbi:MAG: hypothetical protein J6Z36_03815, partial [Clostridia bacterium]|nr:hypothetical protein [Clostridia bacterium]